MLAWGIPTFFLGYETLCLGNPRRFPSDPPGFPKRARGISQTVPKPPMARQHYDRHFPERDFQAFPQVRKLIPTHCIPIVSWMHKLRYPRGQAGPTTPLLWPYMVENVTDDQQGVLTYTNTHTYTLTHTHKRTNTHIHARSKELKCHFLIQWLPLLVGVLTVLGTSASAMTAADETYFLCDGSIPLRRSRAPESHWETRRLTCREISHVVCRTSGKRIYA